MSDTRRELKAIVRTLGRDRVMSAVGVGVSQIRNVEADGVFPSAWFDALDRIARAQGVDLPRHLFRWRTGDRRAG